MSRLQARLLLGAVAVVLIGYPLIFWGWYFGAADRVTAKVTACQQGPHVCPGEGTWTMEDGTPGAGAIDGTTERTEIGGTVRVRATRSWALVEGPFSTGPAQFATGLPVFDALAIGFVLYARQRGRQQPAP
jgi:hypothetical protein